MFCLPKEDGDGRYRMWLGPDLATNLTGEHHEQMREICARMNAVLEDIIRARPELWAWTLKQSTCFTRLSISN